MRQLHLVRVVAVAASVAGLSCEGVAGHTGTGGATGGGTAEHGAVGGGGATGGTSGGVVGSTTGGTVGGAFGGGASGAASGGTAGAALGGGRAGGVSGGTAGGGDSGGLVGGSAGGTVGGTSGGALGGGAEGGTSGGEAGGTAGGATSGGTVGGTSGGALGGGAEGGTGGGEAGGTAGGATSGGTVGGTGGGEAGGTAGGATSGGTVGGTSGGASGGAVGGTSGGAVGGTSGGAVGGTSGGSAGGTGGGGTSCTDPWPVQTNPPPFPPYGGTAFVDPGIITSADPTSFQSILSTGQGTRLLFDRRVNNWVSVNAWLFDARFGSNKHVEVQVNPEFTQPEALIEAQRHAEHLGRLPAFAFRDIDALWIHRGDFPYGGGNRAILVHVGQTASYEAGGWTEEALLHESSHTSLDASHASAPRWLEAQSADRAAISTYARDNPDREDVAETINVWLAIRFRAHRLSSVDRQRILEAVPNRLSYFDCLGLTDALLP